MGLFLDEEERDSLKRDLVGPVKIFLDEIHNDTVVDAKKYYAARARKIGDNVNLARNRTRERMALLKREQEERQRQRKLMLKRAALALALLAALTFVIVSAALNRGL